VAAPAIFGVLGPARAGDVVAVIFPRYYAIGIGAAGVALTGAWLLGRRAVAPGLWSGAVVALALGFAVMTWAGGVVYPRARALRAARQAAGESTPGEEFQRAHREAVLLNGAALLSGLAALGLSAAALRH
jgi:hypothetical protein